MYEETLKQLGFSEKEAEIYQILLKLGKVPANKILPHTQLKRTTVYSILDELAEKGLIEKDESRGLIEFRAKHPYSLKEYLENRVQQIKTAEKQLEAVLPNFISLYQQAQHRPGVRFYEGKEGMHKVLDDSLTSKSEILTYVDIEAIIEYIPEINKKYVKKREKLGIKKRGIVIDTPAARKYLAAYDTKVTSSKLIPLELGSTKTIIQIYDNKVSYITLGQDMMIGLIIADKYIYRMHKALFEYNWNTLPGFNTQT